MHTPTPLGEEEFRNHTRFYLSLKHILLFHIFLNDKTAEFRIPELNKRISKVLISF